MSDHTDKITPEEIEAARMRLFSVMLHHVGPERKIGMGELYETVFERPWNHRINDTRQMRKLITDMRRDGLPVMSSCARTGGGYWISSSSAEMNDYCRKARTRALKTLHRLARMQKISLPEYLGQMQLELEAGDGGH